MLPSLIQSFFAARENIRGRRREFSMRSLLARFIGDVAGATAIEYAMIAGGISIVIAAAVSGIGTNLSDRFSAMSTALK